MSTCRVDDEAALMAVFEDFRAHGYEGAMVRNVEGAYESHPTHRSSDLQKIKKFDDAEWPIIGRVISIWRIAKKWGFRFPQSPPPSASRRIRSHLLQDHDWAVHILPHNRLAADPTVQPRPFTRPPCPPLRI